MKIFLSWSGTQSHMLAKALDELLRGIFQSVTTFLSTQDIEPGSLWFEKLNRVLEDHDFGIVCVNKTNLTKPYIMFEGGSLAKRLGIAKLVPVLIDMREPDLNQHPFSHFHYLHLNEADIKKLIETVNKNLKEPLSAEMFNKTVDKWWPDFAAKIPEIQKATEKKEKEFDLHSSIEEILSIVRTIGRAGALPTFADMVTIKGQPTLGNLVLGNLMKPIKQGELEKYMKSIRNKLDPFEGSILEGIDNDDLSHVSPPEDKKDT